MLTLWMLLATSLLTELSSSPIQFPDDSTPGKSVEPYLQGTGEAKFHFTSSHKHKKKKRKRKKGCLFALHRGREAGRTNPEGRFFFVPLINYYDTDIYVFNGLTGGGGKPGGGSVDPCSSLVSGAGSVVSTGGSVISGLGGLLPAGSGSRPPSPAPGGGTTTPSGGDGGDNTDEDYDYSDGGDSDSNSSDTPTFFSNAPAPLTNVFSSITNGIRPLFDRPNRYFDYYVVRPFNRSVSQLFRWF
ncbi:uncharacterized protein isoform X2 [Rhodnius prolixus]|uniref:uncharacterized protein isoform X2 n=1 Tax=Rhodnius prolixus TaxID=13249 RepID=UPI003D188CE6